VLGGRRHGIRVIVLATLWASGLGACAGDDDDTASTTVASTTTTTAPTFAANVVDETEIGALYRQGLARVDDGWVFTFNDGLFRTDDAFELAKELVPAIPAEWKARGFDHLGDPDVVDGVVYAPLEQPDYDRGEQAMLTYDATTFAYLDGVDVEQHHNSFVTVDEETAIAYTMDFFGGKALLRYDTTDDWRPLDPLPMSVAVDRVQGGDVHDGAVWLSTDDETDGVYRVDLDDGAVQSLGSIGRIDGEGEGIDATPLPGGDLHVITLDVATIPVRLVTLRVEGG
jgi:hypothetical protein